MTLHGLRSCITQVALQAGIITNEELERWRMDLGWAGANGVYFGSLNQVMAAGRKPAD